jgi:HSP20 family molecular chaperone IbpA
MTPGTDLPKAVARAALKRVGRVAARLQEESSIPADVLESEDEYLVVLDVPGATPSDVRVRYAEGSVVVSVDRFREFNDGFEMRFPGRGLQLDGKVPLPDDAAVDADAARAQLQPNGTLQVYLPKVGGDGTEEVDGDDADSA